MAKMARQAFLAGRIKHSRFPEAFTVQGLVKKQELKNHETQRELLPGFMASCLVKFRQAGPSGLACYPGTGLRAEYRGALFVTHYRNGNLSSSGISSPRSAPTRRLPPVSTRLCSHANPAARSQESSRETADAITLRQAAGKAFDIPKSDIAKRDSGPSAMPRRSRLRRRNERSNPRRDSPSPQKKENSAWVLLPGGGQFPIPHE